MTIIYMLLVGLGLAGLLELYIHYRVKILADAKTDAAKFIADAQQDLIALKSRILALEKKSVTAVAAEASDAKAAATTAIASAERGV
jgi:hypothetical protein